MFLGNDALCILLEQPDQLLYIVRLLCVLESLCECLGSSIVQQGLPGLPVDQGLHRCEMDRDSGSAGELARSILHRECGNPAKRAGLPAVVLEATSLENTDTSQRELSCTTLLTLLDVQPRDLFVRLPAYRACDCPCLPSMRSNC